MLARLQIRCHRGQVLDVRNSRRKQGSPPMRVSAREELASPHEGTGGAGPVLRLPLLAVASLAISAVGEEKYKRISISWSGALMLRPARTGRGGLRVGRRA